MLHAGPQRVARGSSQLNTNEWTSERQVRAALIRWICVDSKASALVDPAGIQLWNAELEGLLDLSFAKVPFPLAIVRCNVTDAIILRQSEIPDLILSGSSVPAIEASGVKVTGSVFLRDDFSCASEVHLLGAQIGGDLDCSNGKFSDYEKAISGDRVCVDGSVYLNRGFHAIGEVRFSNAQIRGDFACTGGSFVGRHDANTDERHALTIDGANIVGDVYLNERFTADGKISMVGVHIKGSLNCGGANVGNASSGTKSELPIVLIADGARVEGCVFFTERFRSSGEVVFTGAHIEQNFHCIDCKFDGALCLEGTFIGGGFHWLEIEEPERTTLVLYNSSASRMLDDPESWPAKGNLRIDGFVYGRISQGPHDAAGRLEWLARTDLFSPQPYRQFADVLRREGDDRSARQVLFEMERHRTTTENQKWYSEVWSWILRTTVGYGFFPARSLWWLGLVIVAGWVFFWGGYRAGMVVPTDKDSYSSFKSMGTVSGNHVRFHPLIYSADNALPLVKLGQIDHWQPDPNPDIHVWPLFTAGGSTFSASGAEILLWFRWIQILLGWFLTTMGVAAISGIVRKE